LEQYDLFVGNDSGTAHLAAAMDCPTLVISRHPRAGDPNHANSPARFAPRCSRYRVLQPAHGEGDCTNACRLSKPHCIELVTAETAADSALDLLREKGCAAIANALTTHPQIDTTNHRGALEIASVL
jgi:ADP-heptose:LPS heptosyltransferase